MKAIDLLNDYKNIDFMCNTDNLHKEIDEAIAELESLKCVVKTISIILCLMEKLNAKHALLLITLIGKLNE